MLRINCYGVVVSEESRMFYQLETGSDNIAFSSISIKELLDSYPTETEVYLNIHSDGGSVVEGLAIYDILRTSGKTIYTNNMGKAHSMGTILMLAAEKENRTINRNAGMLIHEIRALNIGYYTADELQREVEAINEQREKILDIYQDRTGQDREKLSELLKEERVLYSDELLELGFVSKINDYTNNSTNQNQNHFFMKFKEILDKFGGKSTSNEPTTNCIQDVNGENVFNCVGEPEVGKEVTFEADKETQFVMSTENCYAIFDGKIAAIAKADSIEATAMQLEFDNCNLKDELEEMKADMATMVAEYKKLEEKIKEQTQRTTASGYKMGFASRQTKKTIEKTETVDKEDSFSKEDAIAQIEKNMGISKETPAI